MSRLGLRRFSQLTGTGLAQPKMNPPAISRMAGTSTVPIGSMCLIGFRVSRPIISAVGSPRRRAIQPCATSWTVIANSTGRAHTDKV